MAGIQKEETGWDKNVRELIMLLFFSFLSYAFAFACFVLGYLVVFWFLLDKIAMG